MSLFMKADFKARIILENAANLIRTPSIDSGALQIALTHDIML